MSLHWRSRRDEIGPIADNTYRLVPNPKTTRSHPIGGMAKRAIDVVVASLALIFFLPLFGFVAALVKFFDRGPVIYVHRRIGYASEPFGCLKFRTMVPDAEDVLRKHLEASPQAARE